MDNNAKSSGSGFAKALKSSFRVRLFFGILSVVLLVSIAFAALLLHLQYKSQIDQRNSEGLLIAKLLARDVRLAVFSGKRDEIIKSARSAMEMPDVQAVEIYDREGKLIGRIANKMEDEAKYIDFMATIPGLLNRDFEQSLMVGSPMSGSTGSTAGTVRVTLDDSKYDERLQKLVLAATLTTLLLLGLGILAAYLLAESMTRPLSQLAAGARALRDGDESVHVPVETNDEIGDLASTFNSMVQAIRGRTRDLEEALEELFKLNLALEDKVDQRTAQLERANKEMESFNYSASHDLRAPLNRLAGFCEAMQEEYGGILDDQGRYYLDRIAATGQQMDRVLSAMLTLYQVQQRAMTIRNICISELVHAVETGMKQREPLREVQFVVQENVIVYGDMKLLWLALENIIGNAWKFTINSSPAVIEFGIKTIKDEKVCFIRDNGAGFNMEYYDKLFMPFQRLHNHDDFPGTGVGLAIVQRIIARHNGRIWLESVEGKGTTCYFVLPDRDSDDPDNGDES